MDLDQSEARFALYVAELGRVLGHAERARPLRREISARLVASPETTRSSTLRRAIGTGEDEVVPAAYSSLYPSPLCIPVTLMMPNSVRQRTVQSNDLGIMSRSFRSRSGVGSILGL